MFLGKETRTAFILDDVNGASLFNVKAQKADNAPFFNLKNVQQLQLDKVKGLPDRITTKTDQLIF